jgi:hypothetical protein
VIIPSLIYSEADLFVAKVDWSDGYQCTLLLDNGSLWKVSAYDGEKTTYWHTDDPIIIIPNSRSFSLHPYRIVNLANKTSIEVNLVPPPEEFGRYARRIKTIDAEKKEIHLTDNSKYEISHPDPSNLLAWAINQPIILGANESKDPLDSDKEVLIINVATNSSALGRKLH